jgi:hypothetical protein
MNLKIVICEFIKQVNALLVGCWFLTVHLFLNVNVLLFTLISVNSPINLKNYSLFIA